MPWSIVQWPSPTHPVTTPQVINSTHRGALPTVLLGTPSVEVCTTLPALVNMFTYNLNYRYLAESYSKAHADMATKHPNCDAMGGTPFYKQGGITNGAAWYSVQGG